MIRSFTFPKLPKFLTFKGLPEPFNQLMRPLVLVSVGLHAALLLTPIPSPPVKPKPAQPKTVKITTLPPLKSKSLATNKLKLSGKTLLKPRLAPLVHKGLVIRRPTKKGLNKVAKAPNSKDPKSKQQNTQPTPPPVQPAPPDERRSDPSNPLSDFPHYPKAGPGCLGLENCYSTPDSLDLVVQHFSKQLPLKYSDAKSANDETHPHVFRFSKDGVSYFLSIVNERNTTFYALADKPKTYDDLTQSVEIPADFSETILASLPDGTAVESTDPFANPSDFFTKLGGVETDGPNKGMDISPEQNSEIDSMKLVPSQTPQQLFSGFFAPNLTQLGYQPPQPVATFGGGQLYELKKGKSKPFYLNLVPSKDGKGTIVVVWRSKPA
jgi:hypothetical protein